MCTDRFGFWREEENVLVVQAKGPYESEVCAKELRKEEMSANIWRKTASNCKHLLRYYIVKTLILLVYHLNYPEVRNLSPFYRC